MFVLPPLRNRGSPHLVPPLLSVLWQALLSTRLARHSRGRVSLVSVSANTSLCFVTLAKDRFSTRLLKGQGPHFHSRLFSKAVLRLLSFVRHELYFCCFPYSYTNRSLLLLSCLFVSFLCLLAYLLACFLFDFLSCCCLLLFVSLYSFTCL